MEINHDNWSEHAAKVQHALDFIGDSAEVLAIDLSDIAGITIHVVDNDMTSRYGAVSMLGRLGGTWRIKQGTTHVTREVYGVTLLAVLKPHEWQQLFGARPVRDSVNFDEVSDAD